MWKERRGTRCEECRDGAAQDPVSLRAHPCELAERGRDRYPAVSMLGALCWRLACRLRCDRPFTLWRFVSPLWPAVSLFCTSPGVTGFTRRYVLRIAQCRG